LEPFVSVANSAGQFVPAAIKTSTADGITIEFEPFDGTAIIFQGEEATGITGHRILDQAENELVQRPRLQFTGAGVTVSDDLLDGKTVVAVAETFSFSRIDFTATEFVDGVLTLTLPAGYGGQPICQLCDADGSPVLAGMRFHGTAIDVTANPFDGQLTFIGKGES
jgi:hypothetical protein